MLNKIIKWFKDKKIRRALAKGQKSANNLDTVTIGETISGCDCRVYVDGKWFLNVGRFSCSEVKNKDTSFIEKSGSLIATIFARDAENFKVDDFKVGSQYILELNFNTEYGTKGILFHEKIEVINSGFGVSIDDIVFEKQFTWKVV